MRALSVIAAATSALALSACASLAPYGPATGPSSQGYAEQRVESNRYRITYRGVGNPGPVSDYALLRAADLTVQDGFDWFEVTQRWIDGRPDGGGGVRPSVSIGGGSSRYGNYSSSGVGVGVGLNFSGPAPTSTVLEIVLGRGDKPNRPNAYQARDVQRTLRR